VWCGVVCSIELRCAVKSPSSFLAPRTPWALQSPWNNNCTGKEGRGVDGGVREVGEGMGGNGEGREDGGTSEGMKREGRQCGEEVEEGRKGGKEKRERSE
jgi:hypothetical protein